MAGIAVAHNCKVLTVSPDYSSVMITCGDWSGASQTYWRPSKVEWARVTALDTTVIDTTSHK